MMHDLPATKSAGKKKKVPDPRPALLELLTQTEPEQPLELAAFLNGTPSLTALEQLTGGEVAAMSAWLEDGTAGRLWAGTR